MKILVTYDGTLQSKDALRYGIYRAKKTGGALTVLYAFHAGLYLGYDSHPNAKAMAKKEADKHIKEAESIISDHSMGESAKVMIVEGEPEEEYLKIASDEKIDIIITTQRHKSITKTAPCPVSIAPGALLIPIDGQVDHGNFLHMVQDEALASKSNVILLGIVPIHIYNKWENEEVKRHESIIKKTLAVFINKLKNNGIDTKEVITSGYPDEEILKAARQIPLTGIIIPQESEVPSEVKKAAALIVEEPDNLNIPLLFA